MKINKLIILIIIFISKSIFAVIPESIIFNDILVGETSEKIVTITNKGDLDLIVYHIYQTGRNDNQFSINGDTTFTLKNGYSKEIVVRFNPIQLGTKYSHLIIENNDPERDSTIIDLIGMIKPLVVNTMNDSTFIAGDSIIFQYNARSENSSDQLNYTLLNGHPDATIDNTGIFRWNNTIAGSFTFVVSIADNHGNIVNDTTDLVGLYWGDTSLDYQYINEEDASLVMDHTSDIIELTGNSLIIADVSNDSLVNAFDASYILRYFHGLIDEFPSENSGLYKKNLTSGKVEWNIANSPINSEKIRIPIYVKENPKNIYALELKINYNQSEIQINNIISTLPDDWQISSNKKDDHIIIVMAGITPLDESKIIVLDGLSNTSSGSIDATYLINSNSVSSMKTLSFNKTPIQFKLNQNYPNPFNSSTTISYVLEKDSQVKLEIFNLLGQNIRTLVNTKNSKGFHNVYWDGLNNNGKQLSTGNYIYKISSGSFIKSKKMTLIK